MTYERIAFANPQSLPLDDVSGLGVSEAYKQDYRLQSTVSFRLESANSIEKAIELLKEDASFVQVRMPAGRCEAKQMRLAGLEFLDRYIVASVSVPKCNYAVEKKRLDVCREWSHRDRVLNVAFESFNRDRRFCWSSDADPASTKGVLSDYLDASRASGDTMFQGYSQTTLVAFLVLEQFDDEAIVRLAAVDAKYRALGVAVELYCAALDHCREKGIRTLSGRVSTSNTSALNIYSLLGARFSQAEDVYISGLNE